MKVGLPHPGLTLKYELEAMLQFFHALGTLVWFDKPQLRELVITEPQVSMPFSTALPL